LLRRGHPRDFEMAVYNLQNQLGTQTSHDHLSVEPSVQSEENDN